jgi:quaternary ammonium compound-resistance protein SugE
MPWLILVIAGLFEVAWAVGLKMSDGFTKPLISVATLVSMGISVVLLSLALKTIPAGTGYAVWTGIGAAGTAIVGMLLLGESRDALKIFSLCLIVAGIAGLKLAHG